VHAVLLWAVLTMTVTVTTSSLCEEHSGSVRTQAVRFKLGLGALAPIMITGPIADSMTRMVSGSPATDSLLF
jgi:hypothetical protein